MRTRTLLLLGAILPGLSTSLSAAAIFGTFDMTGYVTVTATTMTFSSDTTTPMTPNVFTLAAGTGSFAAEDGNNTIQNLNIATEPVGTSFANTQFIVFDQTPGLPDLDLNFIAAGQGGSAGCSEAPAATTPPQSCTPPNPGGSPFTFTNYSNPAPPPPTVSGATWVVSGMTSDGLSTWTATFTSQFNEPFQDVLSAFAPGGSGSVGNTFSATATVTVTPIQSAVPEPASGFTTALGGGLVLVSLTLRKFRRSA
jgi:hypothetical protein